MTRWLLGLFTRWKIRRLDDEPWRHVPPPIHRARRGGVEYW
jgi:hypothetical protein